MMEKKRLNSRFRTAFANCVQAIDLNSIYLLEAQFSGMSRVTAYLRGEAPEHSGRRREFQNLATNRFTEKKGYD
jgi:hypothetical protein